MYYWDFYFLKSNSCNNFNNNLNYFKYPKRFNSNPYGFDFNIFSVDGTPINNALISVFALNAFNEYNIRIDSDGYYPVQINNILFNTCTKPNYNINMYPIPSKYINGNDQTPLDILQTNQNDLQIPQENFREMTFTLGMDSPTDTVSFLFTEKFAEEVNSLSSGKMKIEIFADAKMGNDLQMLRTIKQDNTPNFIVQNTSPQINFMPKLSIFDIPLTFNNIEHLRNKVDNEEFYEKIKNIYNEGGYKLLSISDQLFRHMTSNEEINNKDDFQGLKIRTILNKNHENFWKSLGAITVPLPANKIYEGLQRGFISAQENPYENIVAFKFYELQKYLINTYHLPHLVTLITSNDIFNSLNKSEKSVIEEASFIAREYARVKADERFEERKKFLLDNGMIIVDLTDETRQAMRTAATPVYDRIKTLVNNDDLINSYLI